VTALHNITSSTHSFFNKAHEQMSCALTAEAVVSTWSSLSQEFITKTAEARLYIVTSRAAETGGMIAIRISLRQATEKFIFKYR
jgi:hypothetical protein